MYSRGEPEETCSDTLRLQEHKARVDNVSSSSVTMQDLMLRLANNKRCELWKEATVASFEVLPEGEGDITTLTLRGSHPKSRSNRTKYKSASAIQIDGGGA